jgi:phospholipase/carboxylesterase
MAGQGMDAFGFVHRWLPSDQAQRVFVLLHGTGGNEDDLIPLGRHLDPSASLLGVRGKVLENGMPRFFRRIAEGVFDEEDLVMRTHELAEFLRAAGKAYGWDSLPVTAVGYSNGANIAASLMLLEPDVLDAAVLFRAMVPLEPHTLPDLHGKRVLMVNGQADSLIPTQNAQRLAALLRRAGADVTLRLQPASHNLTPEDLATAADWLRQQTT